MLKIRYEYGKVQRKAGVVRDVRSSDKRLAAPPDGSHGYGKKGHCSEARYQHRGRLLGISRQRTKCHSHEFSYNVVLCENVCLALHRAFVLSASLVLPQPTFPRSAESQYLQRGRRTARPRPSRLYYLVEGTFPPPKQINHYKIVIQKMNFRPGIVQVTKFML